jgi:hypothetical protein
MALAAVGALSAEVAHAGPVNAERLRGEAPANGWLASLDARFALARGNVDRLDLGYGGLLQYQTLHPAGVGFGRRRPVAGADPFFHDRWLLLTDGAFTRVSGNSIINRGFAHARYTRMWIPRLGSDLFVQEQFNEFTRLKARIVGGVGARIDAIHRRIVQSWLGSGYMAEYELNDTVLGDPHPSRVVNHRWTNYGVLQIRLLDRTLVFRNTVYAQPRFDDFTDIRVLDNAQLEARVAGGVLAVGLDFGLEYDSRPPQEIQRLDLALGSYVRLRIPN